MERSYCYNLPAPTLLNLAEADKLIDELLALEKSRLNAGQAEKVQQGDRQASASRVRELRDADTESQDT